MQLIIAICLEPLAFLCKFISAFFVVHICVVPWIIWPYGNILLVVSLINELKIIGMSSLYICVRVIVLLFWTILENLGVNGDQKLTTLSSSPPFNP